VVSVSGGVVCSTVLNEASAAAIALIPVIAGCAFLGSADASASINVPVHGG
jgi:hypothetical protein